VSAAGSGVLLCLVCGSSSMLGGAVSVDRLSCAYEQNAYCPVLVRCS
jgi:hypothetical protein